MHKSELVRNELEPIPSQAPAVRQRPICTCSRGQGTPLTRSPRHPRRPRAHPRPHRAPRARRLPRQPLSAQRAGRRSLTNRAHKNTGGNTVPSAGAIAPHAFVQAVLSGPVDSFGEPGRGWGSLASQTRGTRALARKTTVTFLHSRLNVLRLARHRPASSASGEFMYDKPERIAKEIKCAYLPRRRACDPFRLRLTLTRHVEGTVAPVTSYMCLISDTQCTERKRRPPKLSILSLRPSAPCKGLGPDLLQRNITMQLMRNNVVTPTHEALACTRFD